MCIIIDVNMYSKFLQKNDPDMRPLHNWIEKGGKIAYATTDKFKQDMKKSPVFKKKLSQLSQIGRAKLFDSKQVQEEHNRLVQLEPGGRWPQLKSDDPHIVALGLVAEAKVLVSEDIPLHADFKEHVPGGGIYQKKEHKGLLKKDLCP